MSSSNIIRGGGPNRPIKPLEFRPVGSDPLPARSCPGDPGAFVPLDFSGAVRSPLPDLHQLPDADPLPSEPAPPECPPPGMILIPEEELSARLEAEYNRGRQEGKDLAERGLANVFRAMRQSVTELAGLRERILRESEADLLKLSIVIARKIIQHEISTNQAILASLVAAAVSDCISLDRITIRLNPADYEVVSRDRDRYLGVISPETRVILTPDETLAPGDCVVDSVTGVIDARIETQLEEIYRRFTDEQGIVSSGTPQSPVDSQLVDDA